MTMFGGRRMRQTQAVQDDGPRATFRQLMPFLLEHKRILGVVIGLSALGAGTGLAQPLLVAEVITRVEAGVPLDTLVIALVGLVIVSALLSGYRHYLLQKTGEGVVLSSRKILIRRMLLLPVREFDERRTGDLVSRVGSDTTLLRAVLTQGLVEAIGGALTFIGAIIAMVFLDALLFSLTIVRRGRRCHDCRDTVPSHSNSQQKGTRACRRPHRECGEGQSVPSALFAPQTPLSVKSPRLTKTPKGRGGWVCRWPAFPLSWFRFQESPSRSRSSWS